MVALRPDGSTHFHDLQVALSEGQDGRLFFYVRVPVDRERAFRWIVNADSV
jgi:hypothetical protein